MKEPEEMKADATPHALFLLRAGGQAFAVRADETESVAEAPEPVPLPHAPAAVLGVVCVRGRMYTLLDPTALLAPSEMRQQTAATESRFVVALRGDEQLALAAEGVEGPFEVAADSLLPPDLAPAPLRATLERGGARVHLLDTAALFEAAMQGTERRRRRT